MLKNILQFLSINILFLESIYKNLVAFVCECVSLQCNLEYKKMIDIENTVKDLIMVVTPWRKKN